MSDAPDLNRMTVLLHDLMRGVNAQMFQWRGNKILAGPFKGMEIPNDTPWDDCNSSTKLFGSYEFELHDVLSHALLREPALIVDVGCSEGYYSVGLAMLAPEALVLALDLNPASLEMCRDYAQRNGVANRIDTIEGCRTPGDLMAILRGSLLCRRLIIVDVEGAEVDLLDKQACPALVDADIVVECHDFLDSQISLALADRFSDTHRIEIIKPRLPLYARYEFLHHSPAVMTVLALTEKRPMPTLWLACWANQKGT